ncbi:hypothetical protein B0H13DRAFT_1867448 [Mycena leptocephala]|nr:hypothetical protein B0H13DRAFT_1867448 [Mycena leptocephala]
MNTACSNRAALALEFIQRQRAQQYLGQTGGWQRRGRNADQFDFNGISPFPSRPPSSTSDYSMFETHPGSWSNSYANLGHYHSGPPSSGTRLSAKGKKAETDTQGNRSSSRVASRGVELERDDIQDDEPEGTLGGKDAELLLQLGEETSGQQISDTYARVEPNLRRQHSILPWVTRLRQTPNGLENSSSILRLVRWALGSVLGISSV